MNLAAAIAAVKSRLQTQWAVLHGDIDLVWTNDPVPTLDPPAPVLHGFARGGPERIAAFGGAGENLYRQSGEAILHVFVPTGSGDAAARGYADEAAAILRGWISGGLRFYGVAVLDGGADGNWFWLDVIASFENDLTA